MTNETMGGGPHNAASARSTAEEAEARAKEKAGDLRREAEAGWASAKTAAADKAEQQKHRAAGAVGETAHALDDAASRLDQGTPQQQLLSEAARGLTTLAERMDGRSMGEMVHDVSDFARRHPVAFLGGAALAGFALARFARASQRRRSEEAPYGGSAYATGSYGTGSYGSASPAASTGFSGTPGAMPAPTTGVAPANAGVPTGQATAHPPASPAQRR